MELMSASEANHQTILAKNEILNQQTEEIFKTVVDLIKTMISAGETCAVFRAQKEYEEEAFTRVEKILREKGYFYKFTYDTWDNARMEISWNSKNPFSQT